MNRFLKYPLHLQLFAEGDTGGNTEVNSGQESNTEIQGNKTYTQDELDKLISTRIADERKSWEKELLDQQTEAQKLEKMSAKEKKEYQEEKRIKDLDDREAAINRRELAAQAKIQLADKGIPTEMADVLNYTDAKSCSKSIDIVSKAFQAAVEKAVEERIKGGKAPKKAPTNSNITLESIKSMSPSEINANWGEVQKVLKNNR